MSNTNDDNPNRAPWTNEPARDPMDSRDASGAPRPYDPSQPIGQNAPPRKSGLGCWFWGCLGTLVFTLLAMVGIGFGAYYFLSGQIAKYTDTQAAEIPVVEMEEAQLEELQSRIDSFTNQIQSEASDANEIGEAGKDSQAGDDGEAGEDGGAREDGEASKASDDALLAADEAAPESVELNVEPKAESIEELVLTAEEINALIGTDEELRGRVFIRIEEGRVFGEVSIPMDKIPGGGGRFFNADAEFDVAMKDGILEVRLTDANVKGERIPDAVLEGLSQENLAKDFYKDRKNAEMLRKFESIEVVDDSIILKLRSESEDET